MRSFYVVTVLLVPVCHSSPSVEAPAPPEKDDPALTGPFEIDFSPLPGLKGTGDQYKITVRAKSKDGSGFRDVFTMDAKASPVDVRELVAESFGSAGWRVRKEGAMKVIIEGSARKKFSPIQSLEIKTQGLPKGADPAMRRLPEKKKKP